MPRYFPENNTPVPLDTEVRSLQKINDLLKNGIGLSLNQSGTSSDSFGRLRVSNPFTLFDSSFRYFNNGSWTTSTATGGSVNLDSTAGNLELNVLSTAGSSVLRETSKVFSYQPGKSLLVMTTFVMSPAQNGLRQRVGYFGASNGYYLELNNSAVRLVERSLEHGTTTIEKADWNGDKLDGSGPSGFTLDITKAQILWVDLEWLGVGSVRMGFIINGQFIVCHTFHHANLLASTYITTASLPIRYEITNVSGTSTTASMQQICSTVISEGGYQVHGQPSGAGTAITTPYNMAVAGTYYPLISIKLNPSYLDAVVIPTGISILPGATGNYNWRLVSGGTTTGGSWNNFNASSSAQYNITGSSFAGGQTLVSGFISQSNQSSPALDIQGSLFQFQLQRNSFTSTPYEFTLVVAAQTVGGGGSNIFASMDIEEF